VISESLRRIEAAKEDSKSDDGKKSPLSAETH
jgi:hypothetical protein